MNKLKPFHETIIDAIKSIEDISSLAVIGALIKVTKIPKNHDAISDAWLKEMKRLKFNDDFGVPTSLLEQKEECRKNFLRYTRFGELRDAGEISTDFWHKIGSKFGNLDEIISKTNGWKDIKEVNVLKDYAGEDLFKELVDILGKIGVN